MIDFEVASVSGQEIRSENFQGSQGLPNADMPFLVYKAWGLNPSDMMDIYKIQNEAQDAYAFSYMFRRFGAPVSYCDEYKQMGEWYLTTPMEGLYLTVYPYMGLGFGYVSTIKDLQRNIWLDQRKPLEAWNERMKAWAKEEKSYYFFSPMPYETFGLKIEKDGEGQKFIMDEMWDIAVNECNAWQEENNLPDLPTKEEELNRFLHEFRDYKNVQNKQMRELYEAIELPPEEDGESEMLNKVIEAITFTAKDLLRYTNVRDVYLNILGWQNDAMDKQLTEYYGKTLNEDNEEHCLGMFVGYFDPNEHTKIYLRGLEAQRSADELSVATEAQ